MKKTISVNLKGLQFLLEEDAYQRLQEYLRRLEETLMGVEGQSEIIEDIELRFAELFGEAKTNQGKEVIELADVESAISTLGEPEDYIDDTVEEETRAYQDSRRTDKKLFRDLENANIAGVCAGLAVYFNMDRLVVRLIFIFILLFGGFAIPLYIILWIVIPKVNSHIDRLRMKGRPVTVDNVREEVESAAKRVSNTGKNFARKMERESHFQERFSSLGRIFAGLFGLFALFLCLGISIAYTVLIIGELGCMPIHGETGLLSLREFALRFFSDPFDVQLLWWFGSIWALLCIAFLISAGIKGLLNLRMVWFKYLARVFGIATIFAIVAGFYFGSTLAKEYTMESEIEREIGSVSDSLNIFIAHHTELGEGERVSNSHPYLFIEKDGYLIQNGVRLRTVQSRDSLFHVRIMLRSRGASQKKALSYVRHIKYKPSIDGNTLTIPSYFAFPEADKIRAQYARVIVEIPKGKNVHFLNRSETYHDRHYDKDDYHDLVEDYWIDDEDFWDDYNPDYW